MEMDSYLLAFILLLVDKGPNAEWVVTNLLETFNFFCNVYLFCWLYAIDCPRVFVQGYWIILTSELWLGERHLCFSV
jgi:hypothetical protein